MDSVVGAGGGCWNMRAGSEDGCVCVWEEVIDSIDRQTVG